MRHKALRAALMGGVAASLAMLALQAERAPLPRLIGHGCYGTGGDIWAMEESDFPQCERIERNL
jgi:hypothetical protein